ncbi:hypothetical protein SAZ11_46825 [Streptomyces sp. FXJ1.4098]|nr:hypothetical protein [Streptomyces sp. FXJ1.4098]
MSSDARPYSHCCAPEQLACCTKIVPDQGAGQSLAHAELHFYGVEELPVEW